MKKIIVAEKSLIISCDVSMDKYHKILLDTKKCDGVGAYEIGPELALSKGLNWVGEFTKRMYPKKTLIYNSRNAEIIPYLASSFIKILIESNIDAFVLHPLGGFKTHRRWVREAKENNLGVIVDGFSTTTNYLKKESGYVDDDSPIKIYQDAINFGVKHFALPATQNRIGPTRDLVELISKKVDDPVFYFTGISNIGLGGKLEKIEELKLKEYHIIVGASISMAENIKKAADEYIRRL